MGKQVLKKGDLCCIKEASADLTLMTECDFEVPECGVFIYVGPVDRHPYDEIEMMTFDRKRIFVIEDYVVKCEPSKKSVTLDP